MQRIVSRLFWAALVTFALGVALAGSAFAQGDMRAHFNEGMKRLAKGDYAGACAAFEKSETNGPRVASSYQIGKCNEEQGKLGSAYRAYVRAARLAKKSGQEDRREVARERAKAIEPEVPRIALIVSANRQLDGMKIAIDGKKVPKSDWNKSFPIDKGIHRVVITAPGYTPGKLQITGKPGKTAKVEIPALESSSGASDPAPATGATDGGTTQSGDPSAEPKYGAVPPPPLQGATKRRNKGLFWTGVALTIAGGLAIVGGGVRYGIDVAETGDDQPEAIPIALWIGGVVFLAVGIPFMSVFGRKVPVEAEPEPDAEKKPEVSIEPLISPLGGGLRVRF